MSAATADRDPRGLGRGPLTRWLPVVGQAAPEPPPAAPLEVRPTDDARRFAVRTALSARRLTVPAAVLAVVFQVAAALVPVLMGLAIDRALAPGDPDQLVLWLVLLGLDFLVLSLSYRFSGQLTALATEQVQHRLRATLSRTVLHADERTLHRGDGEVLSTATNDLHRLTAVVGLGVMPVGEAAGIVVVSGLLFAIDWVLGLVVLVGAPVVVWATGAMRGPFTRRTRDYQTLLAAAVGRAADLVTGYRVIKGVGAEEEASRRYRASSREALTGALRTINALGVYLAGSNATNRVFVAGVAGLAGLFAVRGEISVGDLIATVGLTQALLIPLTMLTATAGALWAGALASGGRVLDLLRDLGPTDARPTDAGLGVGADGPPAVTVTRDGLPAVRIAPGDLVGVRTDDLTAARLVAALVGPRDVLPESPTNGGARLSVTLDDVPAHRVDPATYRRLVAVTPHEATLFTGTVGASLGGPEVTASRRVEALRAAGCEDFVDPVDGLDQHVGESGHRLSGGQRQRLALARAYASDAPVLVLHEPTTAVDSVTEAAIAERLRGERGDRSTLVITSSPALLARCDSVVALSPDTAPTEPSEVGA